MVTKDVANNCGEERERERLFGFGGGMTPRDGREGGKEG